MLKYLKIFLYFFLYYSLRADQSCIGIHLINPNNGVKEQQPINFLNCNCNCAQYRWLKNTRCSSCLHKHAQAQTVGATIEFCNPMPFLIANTKKRKKNKKTIN